MLLLLNLKRNTKSNAELDICPNTYQENASVQNNLIDSKDLRLQPRQCRIKQDRYIHKLIVDIGVREDLIKHLSEGNTFK